MKLGNTRLGRIAGIAALGMGLMGTAASCGEDGNGLPGGECLDPSCPARGVAEGNFAISGYVAIDSFFKSVVNFGTVASGVAGEIRTELGGIQTAFGISDAEVKAEGSLGAALQAKLESDFKAKLVVDAQPAKCEVDAQVTAQATVDCQASAGCEVDPGKASVSCMGTCSVEASAEGSCEGEAKVTCEVSGPSLECQGTCEGSCAVELEAAAACEGTCQGTCDGTCTGSTGEGGQCNGTCEGMCQGTCKVSGMAAAECSGKCEGSCKYQPAEASCEGGAKVTCEFEAQAEAKCEGSCQGEFEPPKAECDASASCEASAKADAKFSAQCTPPRVDIRVEAEGGLDADLQAQFDFAVADLRVRLPRLIASLEKANLVVEAGGELTTSGKNAVSGTVDALADGDIDIIAAVKIGKCVPSELNASAKVIEDSGKKLAAQVKAAGSLKSTLGL